MHYEYTAKDISQGNYIHSGTFLCIRPRGLNKPVTSKGILSRTGHENLTAL